MTSDGKFEYPSRITLQREDLGPIVNHVAIQLYTEAEATWRQPESPTLRDKLRFEDLALLAGEMLLVVSQTIKEYCADPSNPTDDVETKLLQTRTAPLDAINPGGGRVAYGTSFSRLLNEGMSTGVIMPLITYRDIKAHEFYGYFNEPSIADNYVDLAEAATMLRSTDFHRVLLQSSHTRHGLYKDPCYSVIGLAENNHDPYDKLAAVPFGIQDNRPRLTDRAKATVRHELERANAQTNSQESDGCIVRRSMYPVLGEHACRFAEQAGISQTDLQRPGMSAIVRGSQFVAHCLENISRRSAE